MSDVDTTGRIPASARKTAPRPERDHRARRGEKVLPEHARGHNRALVLQTLFHEGPASRADLARATGLTRVTVSDLVAELIGEGFILEIGVREDARPGKPAILVDIDRAAHRIVGVDLSGPDAFLGAVLTLDGDIVARHEVPREGAGGSAAAAVVGLVAQLVAVADAPVLGVGVGTPGIVDDDGIVRSAPNLGWFDYDLRGQIADAVRLPVLIANDANAAALAEYTFFGASDDMLLIKVGGGVGAGLLAGGLPMTGARHAAGEIGHVTIGTDGGPKCACGKIGCLEAWLSVPSLTARIADVGADGRDGVLADAGERLGIAVAPIVGALDLSEIVLAGPHDLLGGALRDATVDTLRARTLAQFHDSVQVRLTEHPEDIVLRGAAVMVLTGQLGVK